MYDILFEDIDADEIAEERIQGVGLAEHDMSRELARANQCERCLHLHQSNTCTDLFMIAQSICVSSSSRRQTLQHGHTSRIQHSQQHIEHHIVFHAMLGACGDCAGTVQGLCIHPHKRNRSSRNSFFTASSLTFYPLRTSLHTVLPKVGFPSSPLCIIKYSTAKLLK